MLYVAEDVVQKLQQTADKLIFVLVLLKVRQAAVTVTDASRDQLLYILTALADLKQLSLKCRGDVGHLHHVAAEQGEVLAAARQLIYSNQLHREQRGAGDSGKQSISRLQDTDKVNNSSEYIKGGKCSLY